MARVCISKTGGSGDYARLGVVRLRNGPHPEGTVYRLLGTMRFFLLFKRHHTNKDLLADRFGRLFHLPVELGKLGHEGLVIAADYQVGRRDNLVEHGVEFRTEPLSALRLPMFLLRVVGQARRFKPEVVLASGDIHLGAIGLWLSRRLRVPFVFDVYDNYEAFESARIPGFRWLYHRTLRKADLVVCVGATLERLVRRYSQSTVIISNGVDSGVFRPMDPVLARSTLEIPDTGPAVGYFGAIAGNRGVEVLVEAVRMLRAERTEIRLLLAGVMDTDIDLNEDWIDYRDVVAQDTVPVLINACDVVVIPYLSDPWSEYTYAYKLAEYLACNVPVVATRVSNYEDLLEGAPAAICSPGDPKALATAIRAQLSDPVRVPLQRVRSWSSLAHDLAVAVQRIVGRSRTR